MLLKLSILILSRINVMLYIKIENTQWAKMPGKQKVYVSLVLS
jgi:hypothetical protein